MATVVNEMILEPKAEPLSPAAGKAGAGGEKSSSASGPEMERKVAEMMAKKHERALRLCAY
jgi:hypothetical protein